MCIRARVCVCVCVWYLLSFFNFRARKRNDTKQPSYTSIIKETCISISQPFTTLNCHSTFSFGHRLIFYSFSLHSIFVTSLHISIAHLLLRKKRFAAEGLTEWFVLRLYTFEILFRLACGDWCINYCTIYLLPFRF
jgi:hypothetical protein